MRFTTTFTLNLALVALLAAPATAADDGGEAPLFQEVDNANDKKDDQSYGFDIVGEIPETGGEATVVSTGGDPQPEPLAVLSYQTLDDDPVSGELCTRTEYIVIWTEAQRGPAADTIRLAEAAYYDAVRTGTPPACLSVNIDLGAPAEEALRRVAGRLDTAQPFVQPDNKAITGIRSHLDTGIENGFTVIETVNLFGRDWDVEVTAEGVHTVDWGDGTIDSGVSATGGTWHDGAPGPDDIVHFYGTAGSYTLQVTTDWTVTARLVATGTTRTQTARTASAPTTITVDEVRSTRDR